MLLRGQDDTRLNVFKKNEKIEPIDFILRRARLLDCQIPLLVSGSNCQPVFFNNGRWDSRRCEADPSIVLAA